mmetsp:Transcript_8000/g.9172  ORF Transcript_8000/g.9172 Transcript_8000/m.9172 type:complete len:94 (+) Transcript_8000:163-444(+)
MITGNLEMAAHVLNAVMATELVSLFALTNRVYPLKSSLRTSRLLFPFELLLNLKKSSWTMWFGNQPVIVGEMATSRLGLFSRQVLQFFIQFSM